MRDNDKTPSDQQSPHEQFQIALRALSHSPAVKNSIKTQTNALRPEMHRSRFQLGDGGGSGGKIFRALQALSHQTIQTTAPVTSAAAPQTKLTPQGVESRLLDNASASSIVSTMTDAATASATAPQVISKQATNTKSSFNTSKFRGVTKHRHTGEHRCLH